VGLTDLVSSEIVTRFTEKNPNIKVNLRVGRCCFGDQKFLTAVSAGTGPDVAIQNRHTFMQFAAKKLYKDVTSFLDPMASRRMTSRLCRSEETSWDGKIFGCRCSLMYVTVLEQNHYQEVGLDPNTPQQPGLSWRRSPTNSNVKNSKGDLDRIGFSCHTCSATRGCGSMASEQSPVHQRRQTHHPVTIRGGGSPGLDDPVLR
jgi:hypothetical protein